MRDLSVLVHLSFHYLCHYFLEDILLILWVIVQRSFACLSDFGLFLCNFDIPESVVRWLVGSIPCFL